jgi:hypothetical protein
VQLEWARVVLLSVPAASNSRQRSEAEVVGLMKALSSPGGTNSFMAHHMYTLCASQLAPSFAAEVQNCLVRLSEKNEFCMVCLTSIETSTDWDHFEKTKDFRYRLQGQDAHVHGHAKTCCISHGFLDIINTF